MADVDDKTLNTFKLVAPDLAGGMTDSEIATAVQTFALPRLSVDIWGDRYRLGVCYLAAHGVAQSDKDPDAAGPVASKRAGQVSITYGYSQSSGSLESTVYGREFLKLRNELATNSPLATHVDLPTYNG